MAHSVKGDQVFRRIQASANKKFQITKYNYFTLLNDDQAHDMTVFIINLTLTLYAINMQEII